MHNFQWWLEVLLSQEFFMVSVFVIILAIVAGYYLYQNFKD